ncbi:MAG: hypothetical protein RL115_1231 [Bacteroidota bacterium]|jgi:hypothetical protein
MKHLAFFSFVIILATPLTAQAQFGLYAGAQSNNVNYLIDGTKQDTKMKVGFQVGAQMKLPFENRLFFSPAVTYSYKGYDVTFNKSAVPPDVNALNNSTAYHTVEFSPLLQIDLGKKSAHPFIRFGPSIDLLLAGKETYDLKAGGSNSRKMKFSMSSIYGMFGASLIGQLGVETKSGFSIFAHYNYGIASISNQDGGPRIVHRIFGLSVGKYLKKDKIVIDTRNRQ